jgi:hypothetical protein
MASRVTRAQLLAQQKSAAEAATETAAAAAAATAAPAVAAPDNGAPGAAAALPAIDAATAAIVAAMHAQTAATNRQSLQQAAALAEAQLARASNAAAQFEVLSQHRLAAAGPAPLFLGEANGIEVHRWVIAMERWFEVAYVDEDSERLLKAAAALRNGGESWWTALVKRGESAAFNTWDLFSVAIRKHFLPQDVERWAHVELDALASRSVKSGDVAAYTSKFVELDLLLPNRDQMSRIMAYERGLPDEYRYKCAERRHETLLAAREAMLAIWNARSSARAQSRGAGNAVPLTQMSDTSTDSDSGGSVQHPTSAAVPPTPEDIAERVFAMLADRFPSRGGGGYRGRGGFVRGRGGRGGTSGNGRPRERESPEGQRRDHTPGISSKLARERIAAGQCIRCAGEDHFKAECKNPPKTTN